MIVTAVTVYVKEEHINEFIEASVRNHKGSIKEPGNLRFDVLQCNTDPGRFLLYEAYETEDAAKAHKETEHYLAWKDTVAPWMAKPREGIPHSVVAPEEGELW